MLVEIRMVNQKSGVKKSVTENSEALLLYVVDKQNIVETRQRMPGYISLHNLMLYLKGKEVVQELQF